MEIAHAIYLLPPFHGGGKREITRRPKCYAFDTGFVTFVKGWETIREDDRGILWEHLVLDELRVSVEEKGGDLYYWQDKSQREIDFVIKRSGNQVDTVECKINPDSFAPQALKAFRELYPKGKNYLISPVIVEPYSARYDSHLVEFIGGVDPLTFNL
jgi:predicted AAA+ superfamily ATPase